MFAKPMFTNAVGTGTFNHGQLLQHSVDWDAFELWLTKKGLAIDYVHRLVVYAREYCSCLFSSNLAKVEMAGSKHMVLSALSHLSKYLGQYRYFKRLKEDSGLIWHDSDNDARA